MYAIIESCGKQYMAKKGDVIFFEKLDAKEGSKITFDKVLLVSDEGKIQIGTPYVKNVKVEGKVLVHGKGKKIIVFKMKAKKNYRRKQGHRQPYTKVEILSIGTETKSTTNKKEEVSTKAQAVKEETKKAVKTEVKKETAKKEVSKAEKPKVAEKKTATKK